MNIKLEQKYAHYVSANYSIVSNNLDLLDISSNTIFMLSLQQVALVEDCRSVYAFVED